jgi:GT2 family glycosyltransferase
MAKKMVSIAIVTYNNRKTIDGTLSSLLEHFPNGIAKCLVVVDNHSEDGTQDILQQYADTHQCIRPICNNVNSGFGRAHNQALAAVGSRYHAICNPDILVSTDIFTPLVDFMETHPQIGLCCPKFQNPDGTLQHLNRRLPTVFDLFLRRLMPNALKPLLKNRIESYDMRDVGYKDSYDVPFVSGAFMFCRTQVLMELGGFDEQFFLYFEDADLSRRVQNHGYRTVFFPDVSVTHVWERLAHKSLHGSWLFVQSAYRYFRKWGFKLW